MAGGWDHYIDGLEWTWINSGPNWRRIFMHFFDFLGGRTIRNNDSLVMNRDSDAQPVDSGIP